MALNKREKNLAIITGVLLVPFVLWMLFSMLGGGSTAELRAQKTNLVNDINDAKKKIRAGEAARKKLDAWNRQSLPSDVEAAGSDYQTWLMQLCASSPYDVGFRQTLVKPTQPQPLGKAGNRLTFTIRGEGSLNQLTRWLYGFYSTDYLHRIKGLTIRPLDGSEKLDIDVKVEALALSDASDAEGKPRMRVLPAVPEDAIDDEIVGEYCEVIGSRALFSRYTPPKPDPPPEIPREEPKAPLFDHGEYTLVTGITEVNGRPQVWIETRTTGKKYRLFQGDSFEVGPVQAKILEIDGRTRTVTSEVEGRQYLLALGKNFREAVEIETKTPAAEIEPEAEIKEVELEAPAVEIETEGASEE